MTAINFTILLDKIEDGTKRQTIRQAKCKTDCLGLKVFGNCHGQADCQEYINRIKPGDTLQLYTGMMQNKYCKGGYCSSGHREDGNRSALAPKGIVKCNLGDGRADVCEWSGAKLLKTTTCTESFPIKFEDLTEEIALLDGFFHLVKLITNQPQIETSALDQLKDFLIKTYDAKDGDVFQIHRW